MASSAPEKEKDKSKVHKLSLKGSAKLVAEFVSITRTPRCCDLGLASTSSADLTPPSSSNTRFTRFCKVTYKQPSQTRLARSRLTAFRSFQRGVYPAEDFTAVKKYGLNMLVSSDDQVRAYIKKIMSQLDKWMIGGKVQKLVIVITDKDTGEHVERWQFDVRVPTASVHSRLVQYSKDTCL